jgi:FMN-dependent NADH-azoreductase
MTTIPHLRCSPRGAHAFSSRMAEEVVGRLLDHYNSAEIVFRDLSARPPPLVDAASSAAILGPPGEMPLALEVSEAPIRELAKARAALDRSLPPRLQPEVLDPAPSS